MIKFLFLDNWPLEYVRGFERHMQQPIKHEGNPFFRPERPHEFTRVHLYGTVLRDTESGLFRMWYSTHDMSGSGVSYLCYATSKDGYAWTRPDLDVVPGTNIVLHRDAHTHGPSLILDPDDPEPSRRYKLLMRPSKRGVTNMIMAYTSPDGIHWRMAQEEPVIAVDSDCHIGLYRDSNTGLYQASFRARNLDRRVWRSESADFVHWRRPVLALEPDVNDPPQTQIYGMQMTPYGSFVMGWVSMYNTWGSDLMWRKMNGNMDVQLAHSRDGYCWHRTVVGKRFIPLGAEGAWDGGNVIPSTGPVFLEDEIRFYYAGTPNQHGGYDGRPERIGAASLRPDGFVALHVGEDVGELLTRPFALRTPEIYVNAAAPRGEIKIEVCEMLGEPIEGFTFDDCRPVQGDGIAQQVTWAKDADLAKIVRTAIRLRVRARRADLYSVWMPNGDESPRYWDFHEIKCLDPMLELEEP